MKLNGRKIEAMYRKYGPGPAGQSCADCSNLEAGGSTGRLHWKCRLYGHTAAESTDWVKRWPACGMFGRDSGEIPVIEQLKHTPRAVLTRTECEGQITMF